ncbi:hypothetical protein TrVGV298_010955, partial [Trichoderma virens]
MCRLRRKKCNGGKPCDLCVRLGVSCEQIFPTFEFRSILGPSRSTKAGVRSDTSKYRPSPPKHSRCLPPRIEDGCNTTFDPDSLSNAITISDVVRFYMSAWKIHCLPALHLSFESMEAIRGQSPLITDTLATLAASRLSRKLPQRRLLKVSDSPLFGFRPDSGHECLSSELYGSALRKMSCWSSEEFDLSPMLAFAALVLFCYVESSMGNFKEFYIHSQGVEILLKKSAYIIFPNGAGLLAAWVEVKMQNWWRRAYFGVPEFFQDYFNPLLSPELQFISNTESGRSATILWILCESHRLNTAALIA